MRHSITNIHLMQNIIYILLYIYIYIYIYIYNILTYFIYHIYISQSISYSEQNFLYDNYIKPKYW